jgi:hypothetical protein
LRHHISGLRLDIREFFRGPGGVRRYGYHNKFHSHRSTGRREQYFRFDSEFDGPEPGLDDTTKTRELKAAARAAIDKSKDIYRAASYAVCGFCLEETALMRVLNILLEGRG